MGLLEKGVHPTLVSEAFQVACDKAIEVLKSIAISVDLKDRESLINAAMTYALFGLVEKMCIHCVKLMWTPGLNLNPSLHYTDRSAVR